MPSSSKTCMQHSLETWLWVPQHILASLELISSSLLNTSPSALSRELLSSLWNSLPCPGVFPVHPFPFCLCLFLFKSIFSELCLPLHTHTSDDWREDNLRDISGLSLFPMAPMQGKKNSAIVYFLSPAANAIGTAGWQEEIWQVARRKKGSKCAGNNESLSNLSKRRCLALCFH